MGGVESGHCLYVVNSWDKNGILMGQRIKYCYRGGEKIKIIYVSKNVYYLYIFFIILVKRLRN